MRAQNTLGLAPRALGAWADVPQEGRGRRGGLNSKTDWSGERGKGTDRNQEVTTVSVSMSARKQGQLSMTGQDDCETGSHVARELQCDDESLSHPALRVRTGVLP